MTNSTTTICECIVCAASINYKAARKLVADDVRQAYPDLDDDDAIAHVINTVDIGEVARSIEYNFGAEELSAAYLLVLAIDAFAMAREA